jgi:tetratricopeptide (TPR) repeat protein
LAIDAGRAAGIDAPPKSLGGGDGSGELDRAAACPGVLTLLDEAARTFNLRKLEESESAARAALVLEPANVGAHQLLGFIYVKANRNTDAIRELRRAMELDSNNLETRLSLAVALTNDGALVEATQLVEELVETSPGVPRVHLVRALIDIKADRYGAAAAECRTALSLAPSADAYELLGLALWKADDLNGAVSATAKALELEPKRARSYANNCAYLATFGRYEEAIAACKTAQEIDPNLVDAIENEGIAHARNGQNHAAISAFRSALKLNPDAVNAQENLARALLLTDQIDAAVGEYTEMAKKRPASIAAYNMLGIISLYRGDPKQAIIEFEKSLSIDESQASIHTMLGTARIATGKIDAAIASCVSAIEHDRQSARAYYNLARAYTKKQNLDEAISALSTAVQLEPALRQYSVEDDSLDLLRLDPRFANLIATVPVDTSPPLWSSADPREILRRMQSKSASVQDVRCSINFVDDDKVNLSRTRKTGTCLISQYSRKLRAFIAFEQTQTDDVLGEREWYLLEGRWLTYAVERTKAIQRQELARNDEEFDPYEIGIIPIPFLMTDQLATIENDFVAIARASTLVDGRILDRLVLIPKPGTRNFRRYEQVEFYVYRDFGIPHRVELTQRAGFQKSSVELPDLDSSMINQGVRAEEFIVPDAWKTYSLTEEPLNDE